MNRPIHSWKRTWGFAAACGIIAGIGAGTYWSTHRLVRSYDSITESHQAIEKLQSIQQLLEAGQTSAYNYVITGRSERLDIYRRTNAKIRRTLGEVEDLVAGYPRQKSAFSQFRRLLGVHQEY